MHSRADRSTSGNGRVSFCSHDKLNHVPCPAEGPRYLIREVAINYYACTAGYLAEGRSHLRLQRTQMAARWGTSERPLGPSQPDPTTKAEVATGTSASSFWRCRRGAPPRMPRTYRPFSLPSPFEMMQECVAP